MDPAEIPPADEVSTGLPGLRTWPAVYVFVLAVFALTVAGLAVLTLAYR